MFSSFNIDMITPISFLNIPRTIPMCGIQNNYHKSAESAQDVFTPSFCAADTKTRFETELSELNGIHCARCKQKMLSKDKYENLKLRMSQAQNGHELLDIIEEHKDYLTNSTSLILKDLDYTNNKYPDANIKTVIKKIDKHAPLYYFKALETNVNLLELVSEKLDMSENDRKQYKKASKELKFLLDNKSFEYGQVKTIMNSTLKETDYPKKRKLFEKVMRQQGRAYKYYKSIDSQNLITKEPINALENLCWALFGRSRAKLKDVSANENYNDVNQVLICTDCEHKTRNYGSFFKYSDDANDLKNSFTQYARDITAAINNNQLHTDKTYINKLIKHVSHNSCDKIVLNKNDLEFIEYKKKIKDMPFQNIEGLPCPKCNGIMMTFDQNEKARQNIQESDSLKDLSLILKENKKYLPEITKKFAEKFQDIHIRDPYISDNLMKKKMQEFASKFTRQSFNKFISIINQQIKNESLDDNDRKRLQDFKIKLRKAEERNFYDLGKIYKIAQNSGILDEEDKFGLQAPFDEMLISIEIFQAPVFHAKEFSQKNNWSKKFADRLLRNAIMTKDHMIARNDGGEDELDNTMALHKECNRLKGKKSFGKWYNENSKSEEYTAEYLRMIKKSSSQGKVKGCENYAKNISNKIYKLSGKSNLKNEFCKKDSRE